MVSSHRPVGSADGPAPLPVCGSDCLKDFHQRRWKAVKTSRGRDKPGRQGRVGMTESRSSSVLPIYGEVAFSSPFMGRWPEGPEGLGSEGLRRVLVQLFCGD